MKIVYEFQPELRDPNAAQAEVQSTVNAFNLANSTNVQVHQKSGAKTKIPREGFLTSAQLPRKQSYDPGASTKASGR